MRKNICYSLNYTCAVGQVNTIDGWKENKYTNELDSKVKQRRS